MPFTISKYSGVTANLAENWCASDRTRTRQTTLAARFGYFAQVLRDAGFRYTVHFEDRKPVFDKFMIYSARCQPYGSHGACSMTV